MQPASQIVDRCGGFKVVADWCGVSRTAVQRWTYARPKGTGGQIPPKYWPKLIKRARAAGVALSATDLVPEHLRGIQ